MDISNNRHKLILSPFTLTVNDINRKNYEVYCLGHNHTVEFIKFALSQQTGIDLNLISLINDGQILENTKTLDEYQIDHNTKITMLVRMKTGRYLG